jgi:hypothetical protein
MVRRARVDGTPVTAAAAAFGYSRQSFYEAAAALDTVGLEGLVPAKPGPRAGHKLTRSARSPTPSWPPTPPCARKTWWRRSKSSPTPSPPLDQPPPASKQGHPRRARQPVHPRHPSDPLWRPHMGIQIAVPREHPWPRVRSSPTRGGGKPGRIPVSRRIGVVSFGVTGARDRARFPARMRRWHRRSGSGDEAAQNGPAHSMRRSRSADPHRNHRRIGLRHQSARVVHGD